MNVARRRRKLGLSQIWEGPSSLWESELGDNDYVGIKGAMWAFGMARKVALLGCLLFRTAFAPYSPHGAPNPEPC